MNRENHKDNHQEHKGHKEYNLSYLVSLIFPIVLRVAALIVLVGPALILWRTENRARRGIVYGPPPAVSQAAIPDPLGVNLDLASESRPFGLGSAVTLLVKEGGFGWVRHRFPWAEIEPRPGEYRWSPWDEIVAAVQDRGLNLVAVLDTTPAWARDGGNVHSPPHDREDYGRFVQAFAARYGQTIDYYQVWDEPNLSSHWGGGYVDPGAYTALLREGYVQLKSADQKAFVLTAGLAPTTERGPLNLSEPLFLQAMYAAGAADCFDILAAKPYGFWSGPEDRRVALDVLNFSRLILLRETMEANGDAHKAIWAVEFGWNALPAEWMGQPSPWGTDEEDKQARRTMEALDRARHEWPWLGVMLLAGFWPPGAEDDPRRGFALLDQEGRPRLLYRLMQERNAAPPVAYVGQWPANHYAARYEGKWRLTPLAADPGQNGDSLTIPFQGTRLDLTVRRGAFWGLFYVTIDGQPANRLPCDAQGRSYLILHDPLRRTATLTLASGLPDARHEARLVAEGGWGQWAIVGWTVSREKSFFFYNMAVTALAVLGLICAGQALRLALRLPWLDGADRYRRLGEGWQVAFTLLSAGVFYFSPWLPVSLVGLALLALAIFLRLDLGLALAALSIPFFLQTRGLVGKQFSMVEIMTLLCAAAWILNAIVKQQAAGDEDTERGNDLSRYYYRALRMILSRAQGIDWAALAFVVVSVLSVLVAENKGVAGRELRVVVLEPALFYLLLRVSPLEERAIRRLIEALILAAALVSLIGLYQYFFTADIIQAEGVHRIRGAYASPNNLSLFLGRVVPILAALAAFGPSGKRQIFYSLAALPILACLYLTYSRGAWLLGLPAAFLFMGLVRGGRAIWAAAGAAVIAIGGLLLPLLSTPRIASTLDTGEGTTFLRLKLWQGSLNMIRDHPLLGVGLDNFLYQYRTRYILPAAWEEPDLSHPHNIVLDYWTRLGILGVAVLVWLEVAFFRTGFRLYRRLGSNEKAPVACEHGNDLSRHYKSALALGLMASMVDFLAHGLIDNSYFLVDLAFVFFLTVGVVVRLAETEETRFFPH